MENWAVVVATLLASAVEFVEALTVVLAVGVVKGWRSALAGAGVALAALAVVTLVLGRAIVSLVPLGVLRAVVGVLLLLFGLKWLRKAMLRAAGVKAERDEAAAFRREVERLRQTGGEGIGVDGPTAVSYAGAVTSFNGVFLEGLEVAFIVITFGSSARAMPSAALGAGIGFGAVLLAGLLLRAPLARVPENLMKFAVGLMLTTFGTFWAGEGLGVAWPLGEATVLALLAGYIALAVLLVRATSRTRLPVPEGVTHAGS